MATARRALVAACALGAACASPAAGADLPAGTRLSVRLNQNVYSHTVAPGQPVDTVVIAPVRAGESVVGLAGWKLRGTVVESGTLPGKDKRARLRLGFTKLVDESGAGVTVAARVVEVDGARESVDAEGRIVGVPPRKGLPKDPAALLRLAVDLDPVALGLMDSSGQTVRAAVGFDRGTELLVELTAPATVSARAEPGPADVSDDAALKRLASTLPARTGGSPAAAVGLLVAGAREDVERAFSDAGYVATERLWGKAGPAAFVALAQQHGFHAAPLPPLDGQDAALSFEKQANTLARRHRVRLWPRTETWKGKPVWVAAAERCTDLVFDQPSGTFAHRVDPKSDAERDKVAGDLAFTGRVAARGLVARKGAASGPDTDGRLAVVVLK